jgi:hypothetical protein
MPRKSTPSSRAQNIASAKAHRERQKAKQNALLIHIASKDPSCCIYGDCTVVLNRYNTSKVCYAHQRAAFRELPRSQFTLQDL